MWNMEFGIWNVWLPYSTFHIPYSSGEDSGKRTNRCGGVESRRARDRHLALRDGGEGRQALLLRGDVRRGQRRGRDGRGLWQGARSAERDREGRQGRQEKSDPRGDVWEHDSARSPWELRRIHGRDAAGSAWYWCYRGDGGAVGAGVHRRSRRVVEVRGRVEQQEESGARGDQVSGAVAQPRDDGDAARD